MGKPVFLIIQVAPLVALSLAVAPSRRNCNRTRAWAVHPPGNSNFLNFKLWIKIYCSEFTLEHAHPYSIHYLSIDNTNLEESTICLSMKCYPHHDFYLGVIHKPCGHGRGKGLAKCPYNYTGLINLKWSTKKRREGGRSKMSKNLST